MTLQIQALFHEVELLTDRRVTPGGIHLPESYWSNVNTGVVVASGPGIETENGFVQPHAQPGDIVLFDAADFDRLDDNRGFVKDTNVVAWLLPDKENPDNDRVIPANSWVLVDHNAAPMKHGNIAVAQAYAVRPRTGTVLDCGPGILKWKDRRCTGIRHTVAEIVGAEVVGRRVHWAPDAAAFLVGRTSEKFILVDAADLIAVEPTPDDAMDELTAEAQAMGLYDATA